MRVLKSAQERTPAVANPPDTRQADQSRHRSNLGPHVRLCLRTLQGAQ